MEKITKIGILGFGEVGQAISKFYKNPKIKDLDRDDGLEGSEILNICIPWSKNFIKIVTKEINKVKPELVIIHSTVAPGTTRKVAKAISKEVKIAHSPVRGMHPDLYPGIKTFVKFVGADDEAAGKMAESHLEGLGIKVVLFPSSVTTELGKLLDTTYYGLCIAWHGEMKKFCDKYKVDFDQAITEFNKTYNEGYRVLGKGHVIRPVLYAPKGGIDSHCIIPNVEILKDYFKSKYLDLIMEYKVKQKKRK